MSGLAVGTRVALGHRVWCGEDVAGQVGTIATVVDGIPDHIVPGGLLYEVQRDADDGNGGRHAYGVPVPMRPDQITPERP